MNYEDDNIIVKDSEIDKCGKGLYAKKDFSVGDIILIEKPFYIKGEQITEDIKIKLMELKNSIDNDEDFISGILQTNAISLDGNGSGLFTIVSRINHNCIANSRYFWNTVENKEYIIAVRDIKKCEEITVSYGETVLMPYNERCEYLYNRWRINCGCLMCKNNEIDPTKKKLKKLDDMILSLSQEENFEVAFRCSKKMLELIESTLLGDDLLFKQKIYYDMYQLLMYEMKTSEANNYLRQYLELTKIVEKENSQNYKKKYRYLKNPMFFLMDKLC